MSYTCIEDTEVFRLYVELADRVWKLVKGWPSLATETIGKQLVRAVDSVGANLVEGDGRSTDADAARFFVIARGSARETRYWLQRAIARELLDELAGAQMLLALNNATRQLNGLIRFRKSGSHNSIVKEANSFYSVEDEDPFKEEHQALSFNAECSPPDNYLLND